MSQDEMNNKETRPPHCSFCGKSDAEADRLLSGLEAHICTDCVDLCNEIIHEGIQAGTEGEYTPQVIGIEATEMSASALKILCEDIRPIRALLSV